MHMCMFILMDAHENKQTQAILSLRDTKIQTYLIMRTYTHLRKYNAVTLNYTLHCDKVHLM